MPSFYDNTKKAKNYIMNGAMDLWQRGTSFTAIASTTYFADRFVYSKAGSMVHTISRDTDVPSLAQSNFTFPYSSLLTLTTAQPSLAVSDQIGFLQKIEGQFFAPLAGKTQTLTFWVKSSLVGVFPVSFRNSAADRSYVTTYAIAAANTWEKKSITITHDTTGTWLYTSGIGLHVTFGLAAGTNLNAPSLNSWQSGNYISHSSCVNGVATNGSTFRITGIQLEEGSLPSAFNRAGENVASELLLCQRYFEKSYDVDTIPGSLTHSNASTYSLILPSAATLSPYFFSTFKTPKRVLPSITIYNPNTGATGSVNDRNGNNLRVAGTDQIGTNSFCTAVTTAYSTANTLLAGHYTADAEL